MGKFLRILNRGTCPRLMLEMFGATDKRGRIDDPAIIGMNGTGTKYAPAAASRLGLGVAISSSDEQGPYFAGYIATQVKLRGEPRMRLTMRYNGTYDQHLQIWTLAGRNWDSPIGDDDKKTFRVVREYVANALDEDPYAIVDTILKNEDLVPAGPDKTVVYLTWHSEFEEMLVQKPERWFKRLAGSTALFSVKGFGAIYPKSDPDKTRVFCQGILAYCGKNLPSLFDWSSDEKAGLSEDREFRNLPKTFESFNRLLCGLKDVHLIRRILRGIFDNEHCLEAAILHAREHLKGQPPENKDLWVEAWHALFDDIGRPATIATEHEYDQTAEYTYCKKVVRVPSVLKAFLILCGVKTSRDFVPMLRDAPQYQEVVPTVELRAKFDRLIGLIGKVIPEALQYQYYFYVPLTEEAKRQIGFAWFEKNEPTGRIGLRLDTLASNDDLVETLLHEFTHVLIKAQKHELPFIDHADKDRARFLMDLLKIPHEPRVHFDAFILPPPPVKEPSADTQEALAALDIVMDDLEDSKKP